MGLRSLLLLAAGLLQAAPSDWVPMRWPWMDPESLALLEAAPVNCVLLDWDPDRAASVPAFTAEAARRKTAALAVLRPQAADPLAAARAAIQSGFLGVVLEGDFAPGVAARVREGIAAPVIELGSRGNMQLDGSAAVIGAAQGIWAGVQVESGGKTKAAPTGSPWIDTNAGFVRSVRAYTNAAIWLGNRPPEKQVIPAERYLQMIADAGMSGARWVVALDADLARRLRAGDAAAARDWKRMAAHLRFYEDHPEWRAMQPHGRLALVQDVADGALLSGGVLDMIAVRHTPVRPVPRGKLSLDALAGADLAVNVDPAALTAEQKEILRAFTRGGRTLLSGPPARAADPAAQDQVALAKEELERLDQIWKDVQSLIGRRNLGARLFNVSTMLSNLLAGPGGKPVVLHLVNYSNYPAEAVTVHVLGQFAKARLLCPEAPARALETYAADGATGIDIDKIATAATLILE